MKVKKTSISRTHNANQHTMARLEARIEPKLKNLFLEAAKMQDTSLTNFIIASAKKKMKLLLCKKH